MCAGRKRIIILGSTGSIGRSALEVVRRYPERFEVVGLGAGSKGAALARQAAEFRPRYAALADADCDVKLDSAGGMQVLRGPNALETLAAVEADIVLCAVVGAVGLRPLMAAIRAGNTVAVANKEPFVMAGGIVMAEARRRGVQVLPVDSEHSAIFQCLQGHDISEVRCIHLTASGGPFYGNSTAQLAGVTPEEAMKHPTWDMGAKISVDSATLMNKGLEIIEAMWLFDLKAEQLEVIIHPQSIVHSLVEFGDGQMLAHLGVTDMKFPILFALAYPERVQSPMERLNLARMGALTFAAPDFEAFPCLALAQKAAGEGGTAPAILNAANEVAVKAFCSGRIGFLDISEVVAAACEAVAPRPAERLEEVLAADAEGRRAAEQHIQRIGTAV